MGRKQMQEKKKKERERKSKETVLRRREAMRAKRRKTDMLQRKDAEMQTKLKPITNKEGRKLKLLQQLAINIRALESMEREYHANQEQKKKFNEEMEKKDLKQFKEAMEVFKGIDPEATGEAKE